MYKSAQVQGSSTYNYSQNPDVQQLTQLFLGLATTLDFGRKLAWNYRFDKLGMNQTLRELEELQASHQVEELSAIEPILRKIANDPNLMHISRQSAQHLLKTDQCRRARQTKAQPSRDQRAYPACARIYKFHARFSATSRPTGVLMGVSREGLDRLDRETRRSHLSGSAATRKPQAKGVMICQGAWGLCFRQ